MLVSGEAGLGKTTLAAEAARAAHSTGASVLFGHCRRGHGHAVPALLPNLSATMSTTSMMIGSGATRAHTAPNSRASSLPSAAGSPIFRRPRRRTATPSDTCSSQPWSGSWRRHPPTIPSCSSSMTCNGPTRGASSCCAISRRQSCRCECSSSRPFATTSCPTRTSCATRWGACGVTVGCRGWSSRASTTGMWCPTWKPRRDTSLTRAVLRSHTPYTLRRTATPSSSAKCSATWPRPEPFTRTSPAGQCTRVARESYGKLVAFLAAPGRDVPGAEDALSEAFASALEHWPTRGVPDNPEGWLVVAARRRMLDFARRRRGAEAASDALAMIGEELDDAAASEGPIPDRRLALMFACAHPAIDEAIRAPLMLQTILGLDAAAIASAFLVSPAAMGQRLARAKAKIKLAGHSVSHPGNRRIGRTPRGRARGDLRRLRARLGGGVRRRSARAQSRGGSPLAGPGGRRPGARRARSAGAARADALRGFPARRPPRLLGSLCPARANRTRRSGARARSRKPKRRCGSPAPSAGRGAFSWRRRSSRRMPHAAGPASTDWPAIATLYEALFALTGSPVVAVNRAVAVANAHGAAAGLRLLESAGAAGRLDGYQSYWAAKADLQARVGDAGAADSYRRAIGLESDAGDARVPAGAAERRGRRNRKQIISLIDTQYKSGCSTSCAIRGRPVADPSEADANPRIAEECLACPALAPPARGGEGNSRLERLTASPRFRS